MVAGGDRGDFAFIAYGTVEIFNFASWEWRKGPELPKPVTQAETVQVFQLFYAAFIKHLKMLQIAC